MKKNLYKVIFVFSNFKRFWFYYLIQKEFLLISNQSFKKLPGFNLDLGDIPDVAMTLAILALFSKSKCTLRNIGSWRLKETDRLYAMQNELNKLEQELKLKKITLQFSFRHF